MTMKVIQRTPQILRSGSRMQFVTIVILELLLLEGIYGWTYHYNSEEMSWQNARRFCQRKYTDMVAIQNAEEIEYLKDALPFARHYYWIGIRKINNTWIWVGTGKPLNKEAENWAKDEPNNEGNSMNEDCVEMYIKRALDAGKWNDIGCNKKKNPLCYKASCSFESCSYNGECIETIGNYTCLCNDGFNGPECEHVEQCSILNAPDNGTMLCNHPNGNFSYDSTCEVHCAPGFTLQGSQSLKCKASAEWTTELPSCKAIQCSPLEDQEQMIMTCSEPLEPFSYNSMCKFSCAEGFELQGSEQLECGATGQWSAAAPHCEAVHCATLEDQEQMIMTCSEPFASFSYNSTCKFSCAEGFELKGSEQLECGATGQWSAATPHCEVVQCENLEKQDQVIMTCSEKFRYSSTCSFSCQDGFALSGESRIECAATGQWTAPVPTCQDIQCATLEDQEQMTMTCSESSAPFSYNSTCKFNCVEGFELQGSEQLECGATGQWSAAAPHCEAIQCATLEDQEEMTMTCSKPFAPFSYNSTCKFNCVEGFELQGSEQLECGATGQWSEAAPHCEAVQCKNLEKQDQVIMTCSEKFRYSSTCSFSCQDGFALSGESRIECAATGQWTAPVPTCQAIQCATLEDQEQMTMTCSESSAPFSYNSTCKFNCVEGFELQGSEQLECGATGQWSAAAPHCEAVQCENLEKQDQVIMTCSEKFRYSSTCSFSCQDGFALSGVSRIECAATGQWTAPVPTCQAVKCGALKIPENGKIHCSHPMDNLRYRSVCNFSCLLNYSLNGSVSLECDSSGQWSSPIPTCEDSNPQAIHENSTPIIISSAVASGISVLTLIAWIVRQLRKKAQGKKFSLLSKETQKASGTYKLNEEV
ncbi:E-selectin-like isoform X2 [Leucoraja erinacea]|nr:E-selectin-like isoform X2 [Leucoraja erinacea]